MPQMMPINWMFSLIFFICIFIIFNMMNYYIFNYKYNKYNFTTKKKMPFFWKW
uniref:ATP synthase F0 subunit 8 n=1 Tax=Cnethodonta grisescens TaxID=1178243 RepID=UPI002264EEB5|nr:ATP synthase F0 subunit 8 [Cnethodonta grisescens]UYX61174.1 ATP synthase F0 subunit 8 [Cnethodonta grisescens]